MNSLSRVASSRIAIVSLLFGASAGALGSSLAACGGDTALIGPGPDSGLDASNAGDAKSSGGGEAGGGDAGAPTAMSACADSAKARCAQNDKCTNSVADKNKYGDEATCESRLTAQCVKNLGAPGSGATPATVESCAQTIPTETCSAYLGNDPADTCLPPMGTVANGGACGLGAQCVSTYCRIPAHASCGTCDDAPKAGDPCGPTGECGARNGLQCVNDTCIAQGALNAACDKDNPCGPDLTCVGAKAATKGTCTAPVAMVGAACDPNKATGPGCDLTQGLYCKPVMKQCAAVTFATDGQPCGEVSGALVICQAGSCIIPPAGSGSDGGIDAGLDDGGAEGGTTAPRQGTCKAFAMDGQSCDTSGGPLCMNPARCVYASDASATGTCTLPDPSACK
jgi:hypothetical protein